jgi:predicted DNA-binding transcriptional regulator AlpA
MITIDGTDYYTIDEIPEFINEISFISKKPLARSTLYNYFRQYGAPPSIKRDNKLFYSEDDLAEWSTAVADQKTGAKRSADKPAYRANELMSVSAITKELKICRATLYNYFAQYPRPESVRVGKKAYFIKAQYLDWVQQIPEFAYRVKHVTTN